MILLNQESPLLQQWVVSPLMQVRPATADSASGSHEMLCYDFNRYLFRIHMIFMTCAQFLSLSARVRRLYDSHEGGLRLLRAC